MDAVLRELQERVRAANAARQPLRIRAGGTKDFYGNAGAGDLFDPRPYSGVVDYAPTELVVTTRCGTSLKELEATLAAQGQMLPFEPPHFGNATVGGAIASGLAGPRRLAAGPVREFVLGARLLDAAGQVLSFGGRVMKNVAGYDVARVLAGSMGTLGVILEVSLKVLPRPVAEQSLRFELGEADSIRRVNEWGGQPLPISATTWSDGVLSVRLSGAEAGVRAAVTKLGGESFEGTELWLSVREQTAPFFSSLQSNTVLWRIAVPSTCAPLALGPSLIEWGGGLRWIASEAPAAAIRARAREAGGHATRFRGGPEDGLAFHPLDPVLARVHRRLKSEFDPHGLFNRGRMYVDF
jgi:glycolate oxidase FAD binding subunit